MMDHDELILLLRKYLREGLSPDEASVLAEWANRDAANRQLLENLADSQWLKDTLLAYDTLAPLDRDRESAQLARKIKGGHPRTLVRWLPKKAGLRIAAAAVAALLTVGWLLLVDSHKSSVLPTGQAGENLAATEILPGGNRAVLTLADGRTIDLSSEHEGIVIADGITYLDGSQVMENEELRMENDRPTLNSITTPKGGTYQVTLPDGSKVWLNAGSTLTYPSRFTSDERVVFLEGEAYFEIKEMQGAGGTRDTRAPASKYDTDGARVSRVPFKVQTTTQTVEVLGTQFNISAYTGEAETRTTLVEGSVLVRHGERSRTIAAKQKSVTLTPGTATGASVSLVPGEQATLTANGAITKAEVDVSQYTAWRSDRFSFDGKSFAQIMAEVSRWYDIEVVYEGEVPQETFFGDAFRTDNLSIILDLLESSRIQYRVTADRKLIISSQ